MMGTKTFRSEEERLLSLLDETQGPYPLLSREDPVIFHNNEYERELFMEYNLDFGGESSCPTPQKLADQESFLEMAVKLEPSWAVSPSECENTASSASVVTDSSCSPPSLVQPSSRLGKVQRQADVPQRFNPYTSGPLVKEPSNTRSRGNTHVVYRSESPSKRGRPSKATSNSKMANYARNYREMKKSELTTLSIRNQELEEEMKLLREENAQMKKALTAASAEITQLKKVIDQDSQIARVVANMGQSSLPSDFDSRVGVCVYVGSLGTTVEVCKQCADANQQRLDMKFNDLAGTELFGGDFSAFDSYLNGTC
uniref:BZIP domain-containing protein n=1 Tax=Caenorhabditis japonica TaxID=281687 RepID=A0A8R1HYJ0_CAEJA